MRDIFTADSIDYDNTATATYRGFTFELTTEYDDSMGAPWDECDGHGDVSGWTTRAKQPGERVLHSDRNSHRYYDWQDAVRTARREQWGSLYPYTLRMTRARNGAHVATAIPPYRSDLPELRASRRNINEAIRDVYAMRRAQFPTARAYHVNAAEADFQRLRAWCNDDWYYMGVIVTVSRNGTELASDSLWGIESDCGADYIAEIANECAAQAISDAIEQADSHIATAKALLKLEDMA